MNNTLVYNIPARLIDQYRDREVIVRSRSPSEIATRVSPEHLPHVRFTQLLATPPDISALEPWAIGMPLDIVLSDPALEFPRLYDYATLRDTHPVRVSVPVLPGFGKAVRLAVALGFAVKLCADQPDEFLIEELSDVLGFYLHGPNVHQPIDFFQAMLLSFYQSQPASLWEIVEEDPARVRYLTDDGEETISRRFAGAVSGPDLNDFVDRLGARLLSEKSECCECNFYNRCGGYFKWPDEKYRCDGVKRLFATLSGAASDLKSDLAEFSAVQGGSRL